MKYKDKLINYAIFEAEKCVCKSLALKVVLCCVRKMRSDQAVDSSVSSTRTEVAVASLWSGEMTVDDVRLE